jgi:hypothetical protein
LATPDDAVQALDAAASRISNKYGIVSMQMNVLPARAAK